MKNSALFLAVAAAALSGCGGAPQSNSNVAVSNASNSASAVNGNGNSTAASTNSSGTAAAKPFSKTVEMHGIRFVVESPNSATGNTVTIKPSGLEASNEEVKRSVNGQVAEAEVGDLNLDQSPEVYVYVTKTGPEKGTELVAYATNNKKSMSEAYLAPPDLSSPDYKGFKGENEFRVVESSLIQRFPIFDGDKKTDKMRQIQYKLQPGEAAWQLVKNKVEEF